MLKIGIAVDNWKLQIFRSCLTQAGYSYEECPGITKDTTLIFVQALHAGDVKKVVEQATQECETWKQRKLN